MFTGSPTAVAAHAIPRPPAPKAPPSGLSMLAHSIAQAISNATPALHQAASAAVAHPNNSASPAPRTTQRLAGRIATGASTAQSPHQTVQRALAEFLFQMGQDPLSFSPYIPGTHFVPYSPQGGMAYPPGSMSNVYDALPAKAGTVTGTRFGDSYAQPIPLVNLGHSLAQRQRTWGFSPQSRGLAKGHRNVRFRA